MFNWIIVVLIDRIKLVYLFNEDKLVYLYNEEEYKILILLNMLSVISILIIYISNDVWMLLFVFVLLCEVYVICIGWIVKLNVCFV